MPHDVFISHVSRDRNVATAMCATLESRRIRCWVAPRDLLPGAEYAEDIMNGIADCQVLIVIFSAGANDSLHVKREVERAVNKGKIILPFRIEDVLPSKAMDYFLSNTHWLDALTSPLEAHLIRLAETISRLLRTPAPAAEAERSGPTVLDSPEPPSGYEYRSSTKLFGVPLVHVAIGLQRLNGRYQTARGIIAIGDRARGAIAVGSFPIGCVALGKFPVGLISIGFLAVGVFPIGAIALGMVASYGAFSIAPVALGWTALGYYSTAYHPVGYRVWTPTSSDGEMPWFVELWFRIGQPAIIITLCLVSYLGPAIARAWARSVALARTTTAG